MRDAASAALAQAERAPGPFRLGCVAVHRGRIAAAACNDFRKHAEAAALARAPEGVDAVVVVRVDKLGRPALARPCPACMALLRRRGVSRVWYSTSDGTMAREFLP